MSSRWWKLRHSFREAERIRKIDEAAATPPPKELAMTIPADPPPADPIDGIDERGDDEACGTCGGEGEFVEMAFRNGRDVEIVTPCPDCADDPDEDERNPSEVEEDRPLPTEDTSGLTDVDF